MKSGATDFLTKPLDYPTLRALLQNVAGEVQRRIAGRMLDSKLDRQAATGGVIGQGKAMRIVRQTIESLASSDAGA